MIHILTKVLLAPLIFVMSLAGYSVPITDQTVPAQITLGAFAPTGGGTYRLGNSISSTDTSIKLSTFKEPISNSLYTMAMMGTDIAYGTIAPQSAQSEFISFSGITQNADGSATLTGVVRGISRSAPYTASSTFRMAHAGQSIFILSDSPSVFNEYVTKRNDETISGAKTFTATSTFSSTTLVTTSPTTANMVANKSYVDTTIASATSSAITNLKAANNTWTGTNAFATGTFAGTLGVTGITTFTVPPVSATNPSNSNQVANKAYVDGVAISGAPIANNTTTGIGRSASSTQISSGSNGTTTPYFIPSTLASSTASTTNIVVVTNSSGKIDNSFFNFFGDGSDGDVTISATTTLTRDMYYNNLIVNSTLITGGFIIYVKNNLSGSGQVKFADGNNGGDGVGLTGGTCSVGGSAGSGATSTITGRLKTTAGGAGSGTVTDVTSSLGVSCSGGSGGAGGGSTNGGGSGGAGVTGSAVVGPYTKLSTNLSSLKIGIDYALTGTTLSFKSSCQAGGGGPGGSFTVGNISNGGGGGASGGIVYIWARNFGGSFSIKSIGGNGGRGGDGCTTNSTNAGSAGGGQGGSGGVSLVVYTSKTWSGSYILNGGTGGNPGTPTSGGNSGSAGSNGVTGVSYEIPVSSINI